eukprot:TRINITY_DN8768_c0_g1_i1.p3 TRINITY_DN8768_c0_g1~~TRINITY_DN8768_c0_g1_i1.p3  ORF type:complete len:125 (+),score=25.96 TRINITY_DN8768_c0_g1_i1:130-504(+)
MVMADEDEDPVHTVAMLDEDQLEALSKEQHQKALSLINKEFNRLKQTHLDETTATINAEIEKVVKGKHPVYLERRKELLSTIKQRQDKLSKYQGWHAHACLWDESGGLYECVRVSAAECEREMH